jgi:hypothetical protein
MFDASKWVFYRALYVVSFGICALMIGTGSARSQVITTGSAGSLGSSMGGSPFGGGGSSFTGGGSFGGGSSFGGGGFSGGGGGSITGGGFAVSSGNFAVGTLQGSNNYARGGTTGGVSPTNLFGAYYANPMSPGVQTARGACQPPLLARPCLAP